MNFLSKNKMFLKTIFKSKNVIFLVNFVLMLILIILGFILYLHFNSYKILPTVDNVVEIKQKENVAFAKGEVIYEFVYRPTCKDCQNMKSFLVPKLKRLNNQKNSKVITLNVDNSKFGVWAQKQGLTHTPSIIVKDKNHILYRYQGLNKHEWQQLLSGLNPKDKKSFIGDVDS